MGSQNLGGMSTLGAPTHIPVDTVAQDLWEGAWVGWEVRPLGRGEGVCLSPTLAVSGVAGPVLPWQLNRNLIDSQENPSLYGPSPLQEAPSIGCNPSLRTRTPGPHCSPPSEPGARSLGS